MQPYFVVCLRYGNCLADDGLLRTLFPDTGYHENVSIKMDIPVTLAGATYLTPDSIQYVNSLDS